MHYRGLPHSISYLGLPFASVTCNPYVAQPLPFLPISDIFLFFYFFLFIFRCPHFSRLICEFLPEAVIGLFVHTAFLSTEVFRCFHRQYQILYLFPFSFYLFLHLLSKDSRWFVHSSSVVAWTRWSQWNGGCRCWIKLNFLFLFLFLFLKIKNWNRLSDR